MSALKELVVRILGDNSDLNKKLDSAGGSLKKFGDTATKAGGVLTAGITLPIVGIGVAAIKTALDSQQGLSQTEAVIKSTGGAAGVTTQHVLDLASAQLKLTGIDDDAVQAGENMLLTFRHIGAKGGVFDTATKTALDMATAMNGGVTPSAEQVRQTALQMGKALDNPTKGYAMLQRVGVSFTQSQVDQIKKLQASGDMMGAQKIILNELGKEFGGSAAASGKTFGGMLEGLKNQAGNLLQAMGDKLLPVLQQGLTAITPIVIGVTDAITNMSPVLTTVAVAVGGFLAILGPLLLIAGQIAGAIAALLPVIGAVGGVLAGLASGPVLAIIAGVAAVVGIIIGLVAVFKRAYDTSTPLRLTLQALGARISYLASVIKGDLQTAFTTILPYVQQLASWFGDKISAAAKALAPVFTQIASGIAQFTSSITGQAGPATQGFISFFTGTLVPGVKQLGTLIDTVILPALGRFGAWVGSSILPVLASSFGDIAGVIGSSVGPLLKQLGDVIQNNLIPAWNSIKQSLDAAKPVFIVIAAVAGGLVALSLGILIGLLKGVFSALGPILQGVITVFGGIVTVISGVVQVIVGIFQVLVGLVKGIFTGDWTTLGDGLKNLGEGVLKILGGLWQAIVGIFQGLVGGVVGLVSGLVSGVIGFFQGLWEKIVGHSIIPDLVRDVLQWINNLVNTFLSFVGGLVTRGIAFFINLGVGILNAVNSMVNLVLHYVDHWIAEFVARINLMINLARAIFGGIVDVITAPVRKARDLVLGFINDIKSFFSGLHLQLPHINLPHFSITGSFNLNPPSVPHLDVQWYAKGGIVGLNGPQVIGVGDAGPEAIVPLDRLGGNGNGGGSSQQPVNIQLDGRTIVRAFLPYLVDELRRSGAIRSI